MLLVDPSILCNLQSQDTRYDFKTMAKIIGPIAFQVRHIRIFSQQLLEFCFYLVDEPQMLLLVCHRTPCVLCPIPALRRQQMPVCQRAYAEGIFAQVITIFAEAIGGADTIASEPYKKNVVSKHFWRCSQHSEQIVMSKVNVCLRVFRVEQIIDWEFVIMSDLPLLFFQRWLGASPCPPFAKTQEIVLKPESYISFKGTRITICIRQACASSVPS
jgi:hypothetical protein